MATVSFGNMAVDMRQDTAAEWYGIADMQALFTFLEGFYPVGEQVLIDSNTVYKDQLWDAENHILTVTLKGDFNDYYVSYIQLVANGIEMDVTGDFYVDPGTLEISGTLKSESVRYEADGTLIASFTGLNIDVSLFYDAMPDLSDAAMLAGNDTITAGNANDYLLGYAGNDSLVGGAGNDSLDGGTGGDTMVGGTGNDTCLVDAGGDRVVEGANAGTDTVLAAISYVLGANLENLTLSGTAAIKATGNDGNNVVTGNTGNNTLDGAGGNDTLAGGAGDDTYLVNGPGKTIVEAASGGVDTVRAALNHTLAVNVENLVLTGAQALNGHGNTEGNRLTGNPGANELFGGLGDDTLNGGAGVDTLWGGKGNDTYVLGDADVVKETTGEGTDTVKSSLDHVLAANVEHLVLTGGADLDGSGNSLANVLTGNAGANWLQGAGGADTLIGNGGDDSLNGGTGNDSLVGGTGNDTYGVDSAGDLVQEVWNAGVDTVQASVSHTLGANVENLALQGSSMLDGTGNGLANRIVGNGAANTLMGLSGLDTLSGGGGDDTLAGGLGRDELSGGAGKDGFLFDAALGGGANLDTLLDFATWNDKLLLENAVFTALGAVGRLASGDDRFYAADGATGGLDAEDRLVYDTASGTLYYDPDGSGDKTAIAFAHLGDATPDPLHATDIWVV